MKIEITDEAVIVRGELWTEDIESVREMAYRRGFDTIDTGAAGPLGATMVITNSANSAKLRARIAEDARAAATGDVLEEWVRGSDTGISALTIAEILSGRKLHQLSQWGRDVPHDPADFGRCVRLLDLMDGWRDRLHEVVEAEPKWALLVEHWGELEELYAEELPSGTAPKLYARMKELRERGRQKGGTT